MPVVVPITKKLVDAGMSNATAGGHVMAVLNKERRLNRPLSVVIITDDIVITITDDIVTTDSARRKSAFSAMDAFVMIIC